MKPLVLWRVKSIRNRIDKVYSSDKDPIHDMLLDLPHIVGTLSGYLGSPALRAAFTCSKMERLTGLWERLGELSQRPGAAPTPKTSLPTRLSHSSPGATCIVQRLRLIFCFTLCNLLSANVLIPNMWTFKDGESMTAALQSRNPLWKYFAQLTLQKLSECNKSWPSEALSTVRAQYLPAKVKATIL